MDDLIAWWRGVLDAVEGVARDAQPYHNGQRFQGQPLDWQRLVLMWDPAAALAQVEADRRLIDRYEDTLHRQGEWQESQLAADICAVEYRDWIIPARAAAYAHWPGYREEWLP